MMAALHFGGAPSPNDEKDATMTEEASQVPWLRMDISLGNIIVAASILASLTAYLVTGNNATSQVARDLQIFQQASSREASDNRLDVNKKLDAIQAKVENLPTYDLRLARLESAQRDQSTWQSTIEQRIAQIQQTVAVMQGIGQYTGPRPPQK